MITAKQIYATVRAMMVGATSPVMFDVSSKVFEPDFWNMEESEKADVLKEIQDAINLLRNSRTVFAVTDGNLYKKKCYSFIVFPVPCDSFRSLQKWVWKHCTNGSGLLLQSVHIDRLEGKRTNKEIVGFEYLAYNPQRCKEQLATLQAAKRGQHTLYLRSKTSFEVDEDQLDNYYGEREWTGEQRHYFDVEVRTPNFKLVKQIQITA